LKDQKIKKDGANATPFFLGGVETPRKNSPNPQQNFRIEKSD